MQPTHQQQKIIDTWVNPGQMMLLNAYAGTGKTTTLEMVTRAYPAKRFLYLCYNRETRLEAEKRFPSNCSCRTTHSLAFKDKGGIFKGKLGNLRPFPVMDFLGLNEPWVAVYIIDTINQFLWSTDNELKSCHVQAGPDSKTLAKTVFKLSKDIWAAMQDLENKEIMMPHDGYLKLWAIETPEIRNVDVILLDEAQDTNPVMLAVVLHQLKKKFAGLILVGDTHQSIYTWRNAKDAMQLCMKNAKYKLSLTESFRFHEGIAADASMLLNELKKDKVALVGKGMPRPKPHRYAVISRTNASLLREAILKAEKGMKIHFSGTSEQDDWDPWKPYQFQATLDMYQLWADCKHKVKDPYIKRFRDWQHVEEHVNGADGTHGRDVELAKQAELVKQEGHSLPKKLKLIQQQCGSADDARLTFTTTHRAKGREWDTVMLVDDFLELMEPGENKDNELIEEYNIIYVALTRARHAILLNQDLTKWFEVRERPNGELGYRLTPKQQEPRPTSHAEAAGNHPDRIKIPQKIEKRIRKVVDAPLVRDEDDLESYQVKVRMHCPRAFEPWSGDEEDLLIDLLDICGLEDVEIARILERPRKAVEMRLEMFEEYT